MLKKFLKETPQAASVVVGFACAMLVLEALRTPAVRNVTFEVFHPLPYLFEGIALVAIAFALSRASENFLMARHPLLTVATGAAASLSLFLIMQSQDALTGSFAKDAAAGIYRLSSAVLFVLWSERLLSLGARRAACAYALSLAAGAGIMAVLSLCALSVGQAVLATLPLVSTGLLLSLHIDFSNNAQAEERPLRAIELDEPLPALKTKTKRDIVIAGVLLFTPLIMRGPFVSVQSSWIDQQSDSLASFLLQSSMAAGLLLGCGLVVLLVRFLWNRRCIMFFELLIVPLSLLAFYAAQASETLWFIYVPIVDGTYRALLLFTILMPFLVKAKHPFALMPLGFGILIIGRVPFSILVEALPETAYAAVSVVFVTIGIAGSITALLASGMFEDEKPAQPSSQPDYTAPNDNLEHVCNLLAQQRKLTAREREVLGLLAQRYNAPYIAKKLVLSPSTVKTHMRNLYAKLEVHSQSDLYLLLENTAKTSEQEDVYGR
ncbi:MAG: LuxR C-terminal-related transcriptional regulator [Slackia sp.]|nr:LuxR C-terminal-related transcriptional regulator [Slackia sp.]